jgi:hypothetical protein
MHMLNTAFGRKSMQGQNSTLGKMKDEGVRMAD